MTRSMVHDLFHLISWHDKYDSIVEMAYLSAWDVDVEHDHCM